MLVNNLILSVLYAIRTVTCAYEPLDEGDSCQQLGLSGICRKFQNCPVAIQSVRKKGSHDLRVCGFVGMHQVVCCPGEIPSDRHPTLETSTIDNLTIWKGGNTIQSDNSKEKDKKPINDGRIKGKRRAELMCEKYLKENNVKVEIGYHVLNGEDAVEGQFPHMAALGVEDDFGNVSWGNCGASLISPRFLLTAAHCHVCVVCRPIVKARLGVLEHKNSMRASQMYFETYPETSNRRQQPHRTIFKSLHQNLGEFVSFQEPKFKYGSPMGKETRNNIEINANLSSPFINLLTCHRLASGGNLSKCYKIHISQKLHPGDPERRSEFCNWLLNRDDPLTFVPNNPESAQDIDVKQIIIAEYNIISKHNDIALVELVEDVKMSKNIYPACLYTGMDNPIGLLVSGWGQTNKNESSRSTKLQYARLEPVEVQNCNITILQQNAFTSKVILNTQICAISNQSDACAGDSGGPLQIERRNGGYDIVGIVSYGIACGNPVPGIYTRVSAYLDWIEENVWP